MDDDDLLRVQTALRRLDEDTTHALTDVAELRELVGTLVQILAHAGHLGPGHVKLLERVTQHVDVLRRPPVELDPTIDKYLAEGDDVDCASRMPLCQARCCSFRVALSRQDLEEGQVTFDVDRPYQLARKLDGYCTHLDRPGGGCTRYEVRPGPCRTYTCRDDNRVWIDFEARIPAPMPDHVIPLARLTNGRGR